MAVRYLLVAFDDEKPLGPQLRAAWVAGIPWAIVRGILGRYSVRHLRRLAEMSEISDRQTVQIASMVLDANGRPIPLGVSSQPCGPVSPTHRPELSLES